MAWKRKPKKIGSHCDLDEVLSDFLISDLDDRYSSIRDSFQNSSLAFISAENDLPNQFIPYIEDLLIGGKDIRALRLHCGVHPRCILTVILHSGVPKDTILTSACVRVNQKLCISAISTFRVYRGETFSFDAREAALGNTQLRQDASLPVIAHAMVEVRRLIREESSSTDVFPTLPSSSSGGSSLCLKAKDVTDALVALCAPHALVTIEERMVVTVNGYDLACRFICMQPQVLSVDDDGDALSELDANRGQITYESEFYVIGDDGAGTDAKVDLAGATSFPKRSGRDIVQIETNDNEIFPVPRILLRPCISLTSVAQQGRGKYKDEEGEAVAKVPVDACLFDRVLLFLEHDLRSLQFTFDPIIAGDLLSAAASLGVQALEDLCRKALGRFEERVRKSYITLKEVEEHNAKGTESYEKTGKRCTTWIILSGAVYDISRWLEEHPGGSTIIPQHALDKDATGLFAIYHCSRQSFLYLKEFYIGELRPEDVPIAIERSINAGKATQSETFTSHLAERTQWRLKSDDIKGVVESFKSF